MRSKIKLFFVSFIMLFLASCIQEMEKKNIEENIKILQANLTSINYADSIYYGGDIVTMEEDNPSVESVAIKDGKIIATGTMAEIAKYVSDKTLKIDLKQNALLPGFIDAHGHFSQTGMLAQSANISAPPDGDTASIALLIHNLKQHLNSPQEKDLGWVVGMNYDDSQLQGKNHPSAADLDQVSRDKPVIAIHQSGHIAVVNTKGLKLFGYDSTTKDPSGGHIQRVEGSNQPNGVLEEFAFFGPAMSLLTPKSEESILSMIETAQKAYLKAGFTTAQDGRATPDTITGLQLAKSKNLLEIDVVAYPDPVFYQDDVAFQSMMNKTPKNYEQHFRIGGIKLSLDGSPQGKTAWLTAPYHVQPKGKSKNYKGYPALKSEVVDHYVNMSYKNDWQVLVHSNGDAASDQFISSVKLATKNNPKANVRPVIIHAQVIREDQLDEMKKLHVIPSFMSVHTFYWGDWHRDSVLGEERGKRISPAQSALQRNMLYTSHNDAPVTLPNALMILSSQVNRTTRTGKTLGEEQKVSVMDALKSITINAAYQYFEEDTKGSIKVGKAADFVIIDKNPLKINPSSLNELKILETIKAGKSLFIAK